MKIDIKVRHLFLQVRFIHQNCFEPDKRAEITKTFNYK